jgi:hypothetical protein
MQVDTAQLRAAAARLRRDVAKQLENAVKPVAPTLEAADLEGDFDLYTTSAPYREVAGAWIGEVVVLINAAEQLADALDRAADDYDRSDRVAAHRVAAAR